MQKDLASEDFLEVSAALVLCSQNLHDEAFPAVLPSIINLMSHQQDIVRRKVSERSSRPL